MAQYKKYVIFSEKFSHKPLCDHENEVIIDSSRDNHFSENFTYFSPPVTLYWVIKIS